MHAIPDLSPGLGKVRKKMTRSKREAERGDSLPDLSERWAERLDRVRRSQARTEVTGMTRPPRDPDERAFLQRTGQLGPFIEAEVEQPLPDPSSRFRGDGSEPLETATRRGNAVRAGFLREQSKG